MAGTDGARVLHDRFLMETAGGDAVVRIHWHHRSGCAGAVIDDDLRRHSYGLSVARTPGIRDAGQEKRQR
jgi:hypothetical protein